MLMRRLAALALAGVLALVPWRGGPKAGGAGEFLFPKRPS